MIDPNNGLDIYDKSWRIYTTTKNLPPHYIGDRAKVSECLINEACSVEGDIEHSVLFDNVRIEEGAVVKDSVLLSGAVVHAGARVYNAVIAENQVVAEEAVVGAPESEDVYLLADGEVTVH